MSLSLRTTPKKGFSRAGWSSFTAHRIFLVDDNAPVLQTITDPFVPLRPHADRHDGNESGGLGPGLLVPVCSSSSTGLTGLVTVDVVNQWYQFTEVIPSSAEFGRYTTSFGQPCLMFDHTAFPELLRRHFAWRLEHLRELDATIVAVAFVTSSCRCYSQRVFMYVDLKTINRVLSCIVVWPDFILERLGKA
ncbi:hypothetical protein BV25DRAFT_1842979 [Artomyces pyxidatus]|uniref:Uncharacterized protein n=1 Tax=Artomyces pyxidatus TaxID=48021 RepID=A0ACB8SH86_9AGAM|nr:hypothetical protein BV25DRAFT_1842979 [Artomyces pyxidatus]